MSILWFVIIGIIAGWIASKLTYGHGMGLWGNLAIGVVGALLGGFLTRLLGISVESTFGSIIMAAIGAVILLFLIGLVQGRRTV